MAQPDPGPARRPWLSLLIGVIVGLLCLEGGLRVVGAAQQLLARERAAGADESVVLCLGDSYTRCPGVEARASYPSQLQALLDQAAGAGRYRVVNGGQNGQNSSQLVAGLAESLARYQPRVIVLLTGGSNEWDRAGLLAF